MMYPKFLFCSLVAMVLGACSSTQPASNADATRSKAYDKYDQLNPDRASATQFKSEYSNQKQVQDASSTNFPRPVIMVQPNDGTSGLTSIQLTQSNPYTRATLDGINEYLTKKSYDVKYLEGSSDVDNIIKMQNDIAGTDEDLAYLASLALNADIYIKFSGYADKNGFIIVDLNAYESSTARLLGTKSGTVDSQGRLSPNDIKANFQTAAKKAMSGLEEIISKYWIEDQKLGVQYKAVINLKGDYSDSQLEDLQEAISQNLKAVFNKVKVNTMTDKTVDLQIYADPQKFEDVQDVYSAIRNTLKPLAETKKINITKKLIIMNVQ
ncbi:MAG: hypothetical protein MJZ26_01035 [Fibrobacter sp.]|nr:hypothetical protein [Fibrobacter sp.]